METYRYQQQKAELFEKARRREKRVLAEEDARRRAAGVERRKRAEKEVERFREPLKQNGKAQHLQGGGHSPRSAHSRSRSRSRSPPRSSRAHGDQHQHQNHSIPVSLPPHVVVPSPVVVTPQRAERIQRAVAAMEADLRLAALEGNAERCRALVEGGASVDAADEFGNTALLIASFAAHSSVVSTLLDLGADVRAANKLGYTALSDDLCLDPLRRGALATAVSQGHLTAVKALLALGEDPLEMDSQGDSALSLARALGEDAMVQLIEEHLKGPAEEPEEAGK
jgi:hypothetical protein